MSEPEQVKEVKEEVELEREVEELEEVAFDDLDPAPVDPPCQFITGAAGTGKTFHIKNKIEGDKNYAVLCASTGIAAVNLGGITIHSLLGYYDTNSLNDAFAKGTLEARLKKIAATGAKNIAVDEASMLSCEQIDVIFMALQRVNASKVVKARKEGPLGLILIGDACQLPVIVPKEMKVRGSHINPLWFFKSQVWNEHFAPNTVRLTKIWRQDNPEFLAAINYLRSGRGKQAADILSKLVKFERVSDNHFNGTTIMGVNADVDRFNDLRLLHIKEEVIKVESGRWGKQSGEWKNIPIELKLKVGAYCLILSNDAPNFSYVNGDGGVIENFDGVSFSIRLKRTGEVVKIRKIHRTVTQRDMPDELQVLDKKEEDYAFSGGLPPFGKVSYDEVKELWHVGGVMYYPLRLGFASTVHKSQGLSLDETQVDIRHPFMGAPAMLYTAISRVRTPQGLRIVGTPEQLVMNCKIDAEVIPYL